MAGLQTILVVDDDPAVRKLLRRSLELEPYRVVESENQRQTLDAIRTDFIDLVTLDITLDGEDGLNIAREIRALSAVPIIMVTGKGDEIDTVVGLEMGADDYIAKPFKIREVLARVKSALRRGQLNSHTLVQNIPPETSATASQYRFADCNLNPQRRDLFDPDGISCELTTAEFDLLEVLVKNALHALSRDQIMDQLKGSGWNPNDRTIDNKIARLRKKLSAIGVEQAIKTVRGIGYQFTIQVQSEPYPA